MMVTEQDTEYDVDDLDEDLVDDEMETEKAPRRSLFKRYKSWVSSLPRRQAVVVVAITVALIVFGLVYLSAVIAMEPWYKTDFQKPIEKESQWIEVTASPFEYIGYCDEGQTWSQAFDFPTDDEAGKYVAEFTIFLIWLDDARTGPDTFQFQVTDSEGMQKAAGSSYSGQTYMTARLNNTAHKHVENYQGWNIEVKCLTAEEGVIGPGGIIKIPDDGNDFTVRFEWSYFIEHNPDWE